MSTTVLNAYSAAFPLITNRVRAIVSKQSDPDAVVSSQTKPAPHPVRLWSFPGLERTNYIFEMNEIDGDDNIVRQLAYFDVVPGAIEGTLARDQEQITVGTTVGLEIGASSFIFDGEDGKPDYRGWDIGISEVGGSNFYVKDYEYTWDSVTGEFTFLEDGRIFAANQTYHVIFDAKVIPPESVNPIPTFSITRITTDTTLDESYFGKKVICEPAGDYMEVTLPALSITVEGAPIMFEVSADSIKCVKFVPDTGDTINFARGNLYAYPNEHFTIYKFVRSLGVYEWRVTDAFGNFTTVGQIVSDDVTSTFHLNKIPLDGSSINVNQFARLYNEVVLNLPQSVLYANHSTGTNKYKFSLVNGSDEFYIPDRRNMFEKQLGTTGVSGDFTASSVGKHRHFVAVDAAVNDSRFPSERGTVLSAIRSIIRQWTKAGGGAEGYILDSQTGEPTIGRTSETGSDTTQPDNISTIKYILI